MIDAASGEATRWEGSLWGWGWGDGKPHSMGAAGAAARSCRAIQSAVDAESGANSDQDGQKR